jgi:hypothetical protein
MAWVFIVFVKNIPFRKNSVLLASIDLHNEYLFGQKKLVKTNFNR